MSGDLKYEFNVHCSNNLDDSFDDDVDNFFLTPAGSPRKRVRRSLSRTPKPKTPISKIPNSSCDNETRDQPIQDIAQAPADSSPMKKMRRSNSRTPKANIPHEQLHQNASNEEITRGFDHQEMNKENDSSPADCDSSSKQGQNSKNLKTSVYRQSPRLASIAKVPTKYLYRSPAKLNLTTSGTSLPKALLPNLKGALKAASGQNRAKAHRRSLSDGAVVKQLASKVTKNSKKQPRRAVKGSGLTEGDHSTLSSISTFSQTLASNRQRSMRNLKTDKSGPTRPQEFKFETDKRLGVKSSQEIDHETGLEFARSLRSSTTVNSALPRGPTKVVPFNLHQSHRSDELPQVPFLSMAELNMKFYTKTPQRFRTSKKNGGEVVSVKAPELTMPRTPALSTRSRARETVHYPSQDELDQQEYEEAQKNQFKAKPFNPKVFEQPKEQNFERKKTVTAFEPFDITDSKKTTVKQSLGVQIAALRSLAGSTASLLGVPHKGVPSHFDRKRTEVRPFSFDKRNQTMIEKKKEKVEKIIEEEQSLAKFTAGPMPVYENGVIYGVPPKKPPTPTRPKPFNLRSDQRGDTKRKNFKSKLEEEEHELEEKRRFHAQPDAVLHRQPFIPAKSQKPLTDISGFTLNTELRKEERNAYQIHLKEKEDDLARAKREQEERRRREEDAEVARLRKEVVHKPQPIPHYKLLKIKQGLLPVTVPISPEFCTRTRAASRNIHNSSVMSNNGTFSRE